MSEVDYSQLSEKDLRRYVIEHPSDEEAFQHYLSVVRRKPGVVVTTDEDFERELRKRIETDHF
jgi:hypothetical protein